MKTLPVLRTFGWLMWRDVLTLKQNVLNRVIDAAIWSTTNIAISNFILPAFGIEPRFGILIWVGTIVTMAYFEAGYVAQELVEDRTGNNHLGFLLTLPIPSWLVFIKIGLGAALNSAVLSALMIPLGKIIIRDSFNLSGISLIRFLSIFIAMNLFCGFFSVWLLSWAPSSSRFKEVWRRVLNPLWSFGGYQFTWTILYKTFPRLAFVTLLNPLTYAFEGLRGAFLGPEEFISLWICVGMLLLWTIILTQWALIWLKKLIDYV